MHFRATQASFLIRTHSFLTMLVPVVLPVLLLGTLHMRTASAQTNMLGQCRALSTIPDDVQNCMDNFLDELDNSISNIENLILSELGGDTAASAESFQRSQIAFKEFRRENCLWYLEFSAPREDAGQIAKNCLASMSRDRLSELQTLISQEPVANDVAGYYVYGTDRNSLQLCGSDRRYWVEGETTVVGQLQLDYLEQAVSDLSVLHVVVLGQIDKDAATSYPDHDGVFLINAVKEIRPPTDGDCQIVANSGTGANLVETPAPALDIATPPTPPEPVESDQPQLEPEQVLVAYFGAWSAECEQLGNSYGCVVSTRLDGSDLPEELKPQLKLTRRSRQRTIIDLEFPDQEIDSINKIFWNVDKFEVGNIGSSRIRVDEIATRQQIRERSLIQGDLLPLLVGGKEVVVTVDDDGSVARYSGTLVGLIRALSFADDFTLSDGRL